MAHDPIEQKLLGEILLSLVKYPEDVKIERKEDEMGVLLSVQVNAEDMGVVIGRSGIMADSIKTLLKAIGRAHQLSVRVKFLEPDGSERPQRPRKEQTRNDKEPAEENQEESKPQKEQKNTIDLDSELDEFVIS